MRRGVRGCRDDRGDGWGHRDRCECGGPWGSGGGRGYGGPDRGGRTPVGIACLCHVLTAFSGGLAQRCRRVRSAHADPVGRRSARPRRGGPAHGGTRTDRRPNRQEGVRCRGSPAVAGVVMESRREDVIDSAFAVVVFSQDDDARAGAGRAVGAGGAGTRRGRGPRRAGADPLGGEGGTTVNVARAGADAAAACRRPAHTVCGPHRSAAAATRVAATAAGPRRAAGPRPRALALGPR